MRTEIKEVALIFTDESEIWDIMFLVEKGLNAYLEKAVSKDTPEFIKEQQEIFKTLCGLLGRIDYYEHWYKEHIKDD